MLLDINAHINLDLGIAAAEVTGSKIESLKTDFYKINDIFSSMVEGVQHEINAVSPVIGLLDKVAGNSMNDWPTSVFSLPETGSEILH